MSDETRTCTVCGQQYPLRNEYFAQTSYKDNGSPYHRTVCRDCFTRQQREKRAREREPEATRTAPGCYTVLAIDWRTMSIVLMEATVIEVVADISRLKTDAALNTIIRQQRELHPNLLLAKNPAVKMETSE